MAYASAMTDGLSTRRKSRWRRAREAANSWEASSVGAEKEGGGCPDDGYEEDDASAEIPAVGC